MVNQKKKNGVNWSVLKISSAAATKADNQKLHH